MSILIELPEDLEKALRQQVENLDASAKEGFLVNLYREGKIGYPQLCAGLGLGRFEIDGVLKRHKVYYDITLEDVIRESDASMKAREADGNRR